MVSGSIPSRRIENGAFFVDRYFNISFLSLKSRNGEIFSILLDYLRNGILLVPSGVPFKSVVVEASFLSIDLSQAFFGELKEGVYTDFAKGY